MDARAVTKIVRSIVGKDAAVFNDKLKDGTRSVKVWGWDLEAAKRAELLLRQLGSRVKLVETQQGEIRLHVSVQ